MTRFLFLALLCCIIAGSTVDVQSQTLDLGGLDESVNDAARNEPAPVAERVPKQGAEQGIPKPKITFWMLIQASGVIGYIIILLSLVAVALMIEYALSLRRIMLMPPKFAEEVLHLLVQSQSNTALQKCRDDPSALAQILYAGMSQYEFGWDAVEKRSEEAAAEQASRLYRKVEYLNVIGNIAPMLGLLGTVIGMVIAFQHMADSAGYGRADELAEGIYLALITTVEGLLVAIPCLAAHSFFANRIATLISETTFVAEQVLQPIKKNLLRKRTGG